MEQQLNRRWAWLLAAAIAAILAVAVVLWFVSGGQAPQRDELTPELLENIAGPVDPWHAEAGPAPAAVAPREVSVCVPVVLPTETGPNDWTGPVEAALFGPDWVSETRKLTRTGEARFVARSARESHTLGVILWGKGYFTEVLSVAITPQVREAGTLRTAEVRPKRHCELRVTAIRGGRNAVFYEEQPMYFGEAPGEPMPDLRGSVRLETSHSWAMAAAVVAKAVTGSEFSALRALLSGAGLTRAESRPLAFADKRATLTGLPEGVQATIDAAGEGLSPAPFTFKLGHPETEVNLSVEPPTELRVSVVDKGGTPVSGFRCTIFAASADATPQAILGRQIGSVWDTDPHGPVAPVKAGTHIRVLAIAAQGLGWKDLLTVKGENKVEVRLSEDGAVTGQVVDDTGAAISGMVIGMRDAEVNFEWETVTDSAGNFRAYTPPGIASVRFSGFKLSNGWRAYEFYTPDTLRAAYLLLLPAPSAGHRIQLARRPADSVPGSVEYTFVGLDSRVRRLELQGEREHVEDDRWRNTRRRPYRAQVEVTEGKAVHGLWAGKYVLYARLTNITGGSTKASSFQAFEIKGNQTSQVTFTLVEAASLSVKLVDSQGKPPGVVSVGINGLLCEGTATDEQGIAHFGYHAPGRHVVSILRGGHFAGVDNAAAVELPSVLKAADLVEPLEVRLQPAPVQVRVTWAGVDPILAELHWSVSEGSTHPEVGSEGSSIFRNVGPGTWWLRARATPHGELVANTKFEVAAWTDTFEFEFKDGKFNKSRP